MSDATTSIAEPKLTKKQLATLEFEGWGRDIDGEVEQDADATAEMELD